MRVCLVSIYYRQNDYPNRYSLAVLRLGEYLKSFGYDVDFVPIDLNTWRDFDIREIYSKKYDLVGFSTYSWVLDAVKELDRQFKELDDNTDIIIGGPEVDNINLNDFTREYFIVGEGEVALKKLCDYIKDGKKDVNFFKNNPNVFTKENPIHKKIEGPINIVNPLFTNVTIPDRDFLWYETCRGCAFSCGYCGHKTRCNVEYIDLDIVEKEIINIGRMGFKQVFVIDPNFAGTKERAKKVLEMFNKYAPNTIIGLYFRPEFIDDEMIEILKNANIDCIRIGIQTTNKNVPKWLRSNSLKHINEELPKLSNAGVKWRCELITGLPGDNFDGLKNSIDFAESLNPYEYYSYHLTAIPGTKLYDLVDNYSGEHWLRIDNNSRAIESDTYTCQEMNDMLKYSEEKSREYNVKKLQLRR